MFFCLRALSQTEEEGQAFSVLMTLLIAPVILYLFFFFLPFIKTVACLTEV